MSRSLDDIILSHRPAKNRVDPRRPYAYHTEDELTADRVVEPVATLFLTNRECPFRCTMCDLWKNTLDATVPQGAIPQQIDFALQHLPPARHIKLYNSGNFFDPRAVPAAEHAEIASRVRSFRTVIVENHPRLCRPDILAFRDQLEGRLEIAMGLETVHAEVLRRLNKQMTVDDYRRAAEWLIDHDIAVRTFVLLRPPFLTEVEGAEWAIRSVETAVDAGSRCIAIIPTRAGNGYLEQLERQGEFASPSLTSLEKVVAETLRTPRPARIFADLWDLDTFSDCPDCFQRRRDRLDEINRTQVVGPDVPCHCREQHGGERRCKEC